MRKVKGILSLVAIVMVAVSLVLLNLGMSHARDETSVEKLEQGDVVQEEPAITQKPFQVLISGIDQYGKLEKRGRSDMILLFTVNPVTKKVLVTATSRDTCVTGQGEDGKEKDKLCHLSIYGIKKMVQGMEDLYETEIDYYVQLNFTGFKKLVDAIGGVTVECEEDFDTDWGTSFKKGKNKLDGKDALIFVRERHHFNNGEQKRMQDELVMFQALFEKVMTKSLFEMDVTALYHVWKDNVRTNLKMGEVLSFMEHQKETKDEWKVSLSTLEGEGARAKLASFEGDYRFYVLMPKKDSLQETRKKIRETLEETAVE